MIRPLEPVRSRLMRRTAVGPVVLAASTVLLVGCGGGIRDDLSSRDQELCEIVMDGDEAIGYLSGEVDELIENDGAFSSEGDAYSFTQVPVLRSERELSSRIANYDEPDSAGYIDDPELLDSAKDVRDVLFDLQLAADDGGSVDMDVLDDAKEAIDDMTAVCTG